MLLVAAPVCLSLLPKALGIIKFIINRLNQLKLSKDIAKRIKEKLEYLQWIIKKIEPHLRRVDDAEKIEQFVAELEQASQSCDYLSGKHRITKLISMPSIISKQHSIEADIDSARSKLELFIISNHLSEFCGVADIQNRVLGDISATLQTNTRAGIYSIEDKSVRPPAAPHGLTIQENKEKLTLSWEPSEGIVDNYEVCYDEHNDCTVPVGVTTTIILESPKVQPGNVYVMKVRGINKGGIGEWSGVAIREITKPFPQKPQIVNLLLRSTMAVITVKVAEKICKTESSVTGVEVSYAITCTSEPDTQFTTCAFKMQPGDDNDPFTVSGLQPNSRYTFRVKTQNAEGWSKPSDRIEGNTLSLPQLPDKPNPPSIKLCAPNKVKLIAKVPDNTCSTKSPIIAWKVHGYSECNEEIDKHYTQDENDHIEGSCTLHVVDLNPNQQYTLQLLAKNENGWSEPSEDFKVHVAVPSPPENIRLSRRRTHSVITIRWNAPSSIVVAHYEIAKTSSKGNYNKEPITIPGNKLSATFTKLEQRTQYYFKVRTCNGFYTSEWSDEIEVKTRIHKAIKAALSPLIWGIGTVLSPLTIPVGTGTLTGLTVHEHGGRNSVVAAGAAGGAVGGVVLGIITAPVVGGIWAHYFVHGIDELIISDQSDDEDAIIIEDQ